jgi:hypothetical protein
MTQRVLYVSAQIVLGTFDADGNLTGETPVQEVRRLYYPHAAALQQYVDEVARECKKEGEGK